MKPSRTLALAGLLAIAAIGCTDGDSTPAAGPGSGAATTVSAAPRTMVTESEVREMARDMLAGFNAEDYAAFSRHWDDAMRAGIGREAFEKFQRATAAENGTFQTITRVERQPGKTAGTTNVFVTADFSEHPMVLRLNIRNDSRLIGGVELTRSAER